MVSPELPQKCSAIAFDGCPRVIFRESEVERMASICTGKSSQSRGKSVHEPRKFVQLVSPENVEIALFGGPMRHSLILSEVNIAQFEVCVCSCFAARRLTSARNSCFSLHQVHKNLIVRILARSQSIICFSK